MSSHAPSYHGYRFPSEVIIHALRLNTRPRKTLVIGRRRLHSRQLLHRPVESAAFIASNPDRN